MYAAAIRATKELPAQATCHDCEAVPERHHAASFWAIGHVEDTNHTVSVVEVKIEVWAPHYPPADEDDED